MTHDGQRLEKTDASSSHFVIRASSFERHRSFFVDDSVLNRIRNETIIKTLGSRQGADLLPDIAREEVDQLRKSRVGQFLAADETARPRLARQKLQ